MSFWAPTIGETLYVIALFLFGALAPLAGWAPTDDTTVEPTDEPQNDWSIDA